MLQRWGYYLLTTILVVWRRNCSLGIYKRSIPKELQPEGESQPAAVSPEPPAELSRSVPSQIYGVRNEAGYWVKADPGNPNGFRLKEELLTANVTTLPAIVEHVAKKLCNKPCLGTRQLLARKRFVVDGKEMEKLHLGEYSFLTYREVQDMVVSFSQGLAKIGTGNSGRVAIFAETCAEWFTAVMGCLRQGLTVVTVFPNLSVEEIVASLCETEVSVIMTSHNLLSRTAEVVRKCPAITNVIVFEDQLEGVGTVPEGLMEVVIPYKDVVETGKYLNTSLRQPTGSDVAIIMYTSGSIDRPKGTELTHDNIVSSIISFAIQADLRSGDRFLAFLPLAHVMEFTTEIALVSLGIVVMYGSPMTLTSSCPKIMEGTLSDAQVAKPTCINAAPLILDRIVTQAMEKSFLNNQISEKALTCDVQGSQIAAAELGGNVRIILVGGAPLSEETQTRVRNWLRCTIVVGYGATETTACLTSTVPRDLRTGHCGAPCHGVLVTLADWDEGSYRITDKPYPRGEVLVAGPNVSRGYFLRPEETQEAFVEMDGEYWFKTGDIAEIDNTGVVRIIDRKKFIVKLGDGEFIHLEKIQMIMKMNFIVENVFAYARPGARACICIVVVNGNQIRNVAKSLKLDSDQSLESLCKKPEVEAAVLEILQRHGMDHGLARRELPMGLHLTSEPWTPEGGMVGPAFKLRRKVIEKHFREEIDALYSLEPSHTGN